VLPVAAGPVHGSLDQPALSGGGRASGCLRLFVGEFWDMALSASSFFPSLFQKGTRLLSVAYKGVWAGAGHS